MGQDKPTLFILGATGYIGGQLLLQLKQQHDLNSKFNVTALVRNPTQERIAQLKELWDDITIVEGDLDSDTIIQEQCIKADYVINVTTIVHVPSIISILEGLKKNSASHPNNPPLFIQISGVTLLSDNTRGEHVPYDQIPKHTDVGFDINACPPTSPHIDQEKLIVEAGTRKENPIRTIIVYPGLVYGLGGSPVQKITLLIRMYWNIFVKCGFAGTWGPGQSVLSSVHAKDLASAMVLVFRSALEGRADEGAKGFYFVVGNEASSVTQAQLATKFGDFMYKKGLIKQPGGHRMPDALADSVGGPDGWFLFGSNQVAIPERLMGLGWEATETAKKAILDSLDEELEYYYGVVGKAL